MTSPALENSLSVATEVAGMPSNRRVTATTVGNQIDIEFFVKKIKSKLNRKEKTRVITSLVILHISVASGASYVNSG